MDIDACPFHTSLSGTSPTIVGPPKVNSTPFSGGGLTRYHSAPNSVLAGLLDDDFFPASDDSEFARLLNDGIGSFSSLLETKDLHQAPPVITVIPKVEDTYAYTITAKDNHSKYSAFHEPLSQSPLSSISEHGGEAAEDIYLCNQVPLSSAGAVSQAPQHPFYTRIDSSPSHSVLTSEFASLPHLSLMRLSSPPTDNLSRLITDNASEDLMPGSIGLAGPCLSCREETIGSQILQSSSQVASSSTSSEVLGVTTLLQVPSPRKSTSLLRQSSSPACLLSQINLEEFTTHGVSSAEVFPDKRGYISLKGRAIGGWDGMQHLPALSQRKRGRLIEDKPSSSTQGSPELASPVLTNHITVPNTMVGTVVSLEGCPEDIVLCKARAKRGCATHPRSIAERERRMKISERMKKLQDLVPNLDKQASTSEMLDEVVEYVKLLQQQVQELSLNRPACTGACQQKTESLH